MVGALAAASKTQAVCKQIVWHVKASQQCKCVVKQAAPFCCEGQAQPLGAPVWQCVV